MQFDPLEHYAYPQLDVQCVCDLCQAWRNERDTFDALKRLTFSHDRSCTCWRCQARRRHQQSFLASAARRELYSEMSWHAKSHPSYGIKLMNWVTKEIDENDETEGWWATLAQAYSLAYWFAKFQHDVYPETRPGAKPKEEPTLNGFNHREKKSLPQWWCGWCGEDLPLNESKFCSPQCSSDATAYATTGGVSRTKRRLPMSHHLFVISGSTSVPVCGTVNWASSGVAA